MGKPTGFLELRRETPPKRPIAERINDWREVYAEMPVEQKRRQAARCMDCGVPFCNQGCPLGNLIPDWNDLVYRDNWRAAYDALLKTNNFPEFTGKICPAPCEASCVLGINDDPVTIKAIEWGIIERAWREGWVQANPPRRRTGKRVAVVGSGPAGLAAADQLNKTGHSVTVFERAPRVGGLLTFGIPDFKMEKHVIERRVEIMEEEGVAFRTGVNIGVDVSAKDIVKGHHAVVLCLGATAPRDLDVPGRELQGIHLAMDYLTAQNMEVHGDRPEEMPLISAKGRHVVILGGGDTGADCYGTAIRQGAASVLQMEYNLRPPDERPWYNPWPEWPVTFYTLPAHEEGGERRWSLLTKEFLGDEHGRVRAIRAVRLEWTDGPKPERRRRELRDDVVEIETDLVLVAIGYKGPQRYGPIEELDLRLDRRGNIRTDASYMTSMPGVFSAGDARRGQSLVVWAITEGRKAARGVDLYLMGWSDLPG